MASVPSVANRLFLRLPPLPRGKYRRRIPTSVISVPSVATRRRFLRLPQLPRGKHRRRNRPSLRSYALRGSPRCSLLVTR